jgi:ABC-type transporter Mla subunit MlaD
MQKELNPDLFPGDRRTPAQRESNPPAGAESGRSGAGHEPQRGYRQSLENQQLAQETDEKFAEVRLQLKLLQEKVISVVGQVNEFIKTSQVRSDRNQTTIKNIETQQTTALQDVLGKLSHVHHRLNERRNMEQKIQELIDRHNSVLRSYEVRMSQMQRLLSEKESQFLQSQAQMNELKMELARLKRM